MTRFAPLAALALCAAAPAQDGPKRYAVLIGVNEYDHPALPDLRYSVADAVELADVLKPAGYTVVLLADGQPLKPTKEAIDAALAKVLTRCRPGDTVVIAFSGHGLQFQGTKDAYFCPSDARPSVNGKNSLVSMAKLYADLADSFAGVKLLLVDACRNDPGPDRDDAVGLRGVDADSAPNPPRGVAAFFSCSAGERAVEHKSFGHGVFFHYVLKGLRGEAKNARGAVTFNSLTDYVAGHVSDEVPKLTKGQAKQSPNQKADLSGASPVLLASVTVESGKAALNRGLALYLGRGGRQDLTAAADQFRAAAEAGNPDAMFLLGRILRLRSDPACRDWLEKADRAGHPLAPVELAGVYRLGLGVTKDDPRSDQLYVRALPGVKAAAGAGDPVGMVRFGSMHLIGKGGLAKSDAEAVRWFQKAAAVGEPEAAVLLGMMMFSGEGGLRKDEAEAVNWVRKAAEAGEPRGMVELGLSYESGTGVPKDEAAAGDWYRKAAALGDPRAFVKRGYMSASGRMGATKDDAEAVRWFRKAADAGNTQAMNNLGKLAEIGSGGLTPAETTGWFKRAGEAGDAAGWFNLAVLYEFGRAGVAKDDAEAVKWYRKAADAGHGAGMSGLGYMYAAGRGGLAQDDAEAVRWFRKGAEAGHGGGMVNLGVMYSRGGGGLPLDEVEAAKWYRKGADAGNADGMAKYGLMVEEGKGGLTKDDAEAVRWYKKSADAGSWRGMNNLGGMYEAGRGGLPKDVGQAVEWYKKAAKAGSESAKDNLQRLGVAP